MKTNSENNDKNDVDIDIFIQDDRIIDIFTKAEKKTKIERKELTTNKNR